MEGLHYDLNFLNVGERWEPKEDAQRFNNYKFAREQFELTPEDFTKSVLPEGLLNLSGYQDFVEWNRFLPYPRLMTIKTVDMVIGEPPTINAQADEKEIMTQIIRDIRSSSQLNSVMRSALIDYSRFGVTVLRVFKDDSGKAKVTAWDPREWYPVFYSDGTKRIKYNVLGWRHSNNLLTVQIHETATGAYEERILRLSQDSHIEAVVFAKKYNTSSKKKLCFALVNTPTTTNPLGVGDYEIINGLLQKAIARLCAILRVLDEHADPSMSGPSSLLETTSTGERVFKTSKYYAIGDEEKQPEYIVWKAELESSFKAFETLIKHIFILSEMGEAFLGTSEGTGNVVSGSAMRFKLVSPLEKARRIAHTLTEPFKEIISSLLFIEGHSIEPLNLNISWRDSLPKDPREIAELSRLESGAPAVKPLEKALEDNYGLDNATARELVSLIIDQQEQFNPKKDDEINSADGRTQTVTKVDSRKKGSPKDPASSENRGEDSKK